MMGNLKVSEYDSEQMKKNSKCPEKRHFEKNFDSIETFCFDFTSFPTSQNNSNKVNTDYFHMEKFKRKHSLKQFLSQLAYQNSILVWMDFSIRPFQLAPYLGFTHH